MTLAVMSALNTMKIPVPPHALQSSPNILTHSKFQNVIVIEYVGYPNIRRLDGVAE